MRTVFLLTIACFFYEVSGQEVTIKKQSNKTFQKLKADSPFHFLEERIDTSRLSYIATLSIKANASQGVEAMYNEGRDWAKKNGANAFRLTNFDDLSLQFDVYNADKETLELNENLKQKNTIYVFAGEKNEKTEYYTFEFNGAPKTIKNGTYFTYALKEGEQVKLKKGTVTGTTMWIKWKPDQSSHYISIHGFYSQPVVARTSVSQSFKPGKFLPVDDNFGKLLTVVLKPGEL